MTKHLMFITLQVRKTKTQFSFFNTKFLIGLVFNIDHIPWLFDITETQKSWHDSHEKLIEFFALTNSSFYEHLAHNTWSNSWQITYWVQTNDEICNSGSAFPSSVVKVRNIDTVMTAAVAHKGEPRGVTDITCCRSACDWNDVTATGRAV